MSLVQPIAVLAGDHFDTVGVVALASTRALATANADPSLSPESAARWQTWLGSSFTKSVRRVKKPSQLDKLRSLGLPFTEETTGADGLSGEQQVTALAFEPMEYDDFPRELRSLQVTGLQGTAQTFAFSRRSPWAPAMPVIELNAEAEMSTGKAAAQAAHALCAWLLLQDEKTQLAWASVPALGITTASTFTSNPILVKNRPAKADDIIVIQDNGLTEVAPGTATARVLIAAR